MADWKTFLDTVDAEETDKDVLREAEEFLLAAKFRSPQSASGISMAKLEQHPAFPKELPTQAFVSRTVEALSAVAAARRAAKELSTANAGMSQPSLGSALSVATMLAPPKAVDVNALLKGVQLEKLPFSLQLDQGMVDRMASETETAKRLGRKPFTFVELTGKETLPLWLAPETAGGKVEDEFAALDTGGSIDSLAKLGQALKGATDAKRFFPSIHQWAAAFLRYAPFAVATEQLDWPMVLTHLNSIFRLVEEERCEGRGPQLAILYDELLRRQLERRAQKGDPTLDMHAMMADPDKSILAAAKQRLESVLKAAHRGRSAPSGSGAAGRALAYSHKEQALAAAKALGEQQAERMVAAGAAAKGSASESGQHKKDKKQLSNRDEKKRQWIQNKRSEWGRGKRHHR